MYQSIDTENFHSIDSTNKYYVVNAVSGSYLLLLTEEITNDRIVVLVLFSFIDVRICDSVRGFSTTSVKVLFFIFLRKLSYFDRFCNKVKKSRIKKNMFRHVYLF